MNLRTAHPTLPLRKEVPMMRCPIMSNPVILRFSEACPGHPRRPGAQIAPDSRALNYMNNMGKTGRYG